MQDIYETLEKIHGEIERWIEKYQIEDADVEAMDEAFEALYAPEDETADEGDVDGDEGE